MLELRSRRKQILMLRMEFLEVRKRVVRMRRKK
jgi:hypothetical protein